MIARGFQRIKTWFKDLPHLIKKFIAKLFNEGEENYNRIHGKFINAIRVFIAASRKFLLDDCFTKASSIAYTTIVSLIPTLTVALTFYSIFSGVGDKKEEIFKNISQFMQTHNIKINIDIFIEVISTLIDNAAKIGGVGAAALIFSATAVLRTIEQSLNDIWKVKKTRSIFVKLVYYWTALSLGPIMLVAGSAISSEVTSVLASSNYKSIALSSDQKVWITGNKGSVAFSEPGKIQFKPITLDQIDSDNQELYSYSAEENAFTKLDYKLEEKEILKADYQHIFWRGNNAWAVGKNGMVLKSRDGGRIWQVNKLDNFHLNMILMVDEENGFIVADSGYLLATKDGGASWEVLQWNNLAANLNSIGVYETKVVIAGDRGNMLISNDLGKTWSHKILSEAKRKKKMVNLNSVLLNSANEIWLAGDEGLLAQSEDGGKSWKEKRFVDYNFKSLVFPNAKNGYVASDNGNIYATKDGGDKWVKLKIPENRVNQLVFFKTGTSRGIWSAGDMGTVMHSMDDGKTWELTQGKSFIIYTFNFFMPFIFIWFLFLLTYMGFPNVKVPFRFAAIGASFTSAVWVIFILLFTYYVKAFASGTFAIYGTLAAIPLFLLLIYASALILLYGAEVSFTLMYPQTYLSIKKQELQREEKHSVLIGISVLYTVYRNFESGKGPTSINELLKSVSVKQDELDYLLQVFKAKKLLLEAESRFFAPGMLAQNVQLADIFDLIEDSDYHLPLSNMNDSFKDYLVGLFKNIDKSRKEILGKKSLKNLIDEMR